MPGEGAPAQKLLTPAQILAMLLTVGGPGSGLDADTVDGIHAAGFVQLAGTQTISGAKTISAQLTSTVATGTAPFVVASTTVVANLNASLLLGGTWASPGAIGGTTPAAGAFTTISATGAITSTVATGTAPLTVASTTVVANLNASLLGGNAASAFLLQSVATAKGDLIVATASGTLARLAVGSNTFVLTADSTQASGVKWAAASGGSTPTGTGFVHVTAGVQDGAAALIANADVSASAAIALSKLATQATATFVGNNTGSTAAPIALTAAQAAAMLPAFIASGASHAAGLVPDPGVTAGTTKFLREDATWAVPAGSGISGLTATRIPFATSATTIADSADMTFASGTGTLTLGNATASHVISSTAASTSTSTGALIVSGGAAFAKSINVGLASRFGASGTAASLLHLKQSADATTGGLRFERTSTTDYQDLFISAGAGSLNDALTFYTSFLSGAAFMVDRSGIGYFSSKLLIGSTTDAGTGALQVTGAMAVSAGATITGTLLHTAGGLGLGVSSNAAAGSTTTMVASSRPIQVLTGSAAQTYTLPAANVQGANISAVYVFKNMSTGTMTIQRAGSDTINSLSASGVTSFTVATWGVAMLVSDGSATWERII